MDVIAYFEKNYRHLLLSAAQILKDADAAQDVLHNVAITLLKKQEELADVRHVPAYVAQCIYRASLSHIRKEARAVPEDPALLSEACAHPRAEVGYDYAEWVISLEGHLQAHPPEMRRAFLDHYLDDVPVETLAERLGITPNALSLRFWRMRQALRAEAPSMLKHIDVFTLL